MLGGVRTCATPCGRATFPHSRARSSASRCEPRSREGSAGSPFSDNDAPSGKSSIGIAVRSLGAAVEPFRLQHHVHFGRVRNRAALRLRPFLGEQLCVRAAAFEAGSVTGRERRHLVEEEQRGIAVAPDRVMPVLEAQHAADPLPRGPAALAQGLVVAMKAPAAIAEQQCRAQALRPVRRTGRRDSAAARDGFSVSSAARDAPAGWRSAGPRPGRCPRALLEFALELFLALPLDLRSPSFCPLPPPASPHEMGRSGANVNPTCASWAPAARAWSAG